MAMFSFVTSVVLRIVALVKRMLCFLHLTRHRKNSGNILPLHADVKVLSSVGEIQTSLPSNNVELESWDSWGADDRGEFGRRSGEQNSGNLRHGNRFPAKKGAEPEPEPEVDYFQELHLEPAISRTKKIIVRRKDDHTSSHSSVSSRLAMTSDIPLSGNELGTLDDAESAGWANEAMEDLTGEAEFAMRETRRVERERRMAEHQVKKHEKEASTRNVMKKDRISAVKLS